MSDELYWKDKGGYFRTYINNSFFKENVFVKDIYSETELPDFTKIMNELPEPIWEDNKPAIDCYYKAWEIAFKNIKKPSIENGFTQNYIFPTFNGNIYMWDTVFMLMFGLYCTNIFPLQKSLNNFYSKQHSDGFICREITEEGEDVFHRYDPSSTGPNLLAWSEWNYYNVTGDIDRLNKVFPVLAGYHRWLKNFRTWQDGSYYSSGWGCGMDNQPRIKQEYQFEFFHGFMSWIDITLQQLLSANLLVKISRVLNRKKDGKEFAEEAEKLFYLVNQKMWNDEKQFYFDKYADGSLSNVMSIGSFWALLADAVPKDKQQGFINHLRDINTFNRPHRIPTLAFNAIGYKKTGGYWCGGVWSPTNYMVLKGLDHIEEYKLVHEIGKNHFENVLEVYKNTGTLFENYAPEQITKGDTAVKDFVGWTGISAINVLFEFVFGIKPNVPKNQIVWNINLTSRHGIRNYPFSNGNRIDLICEERKNEEIEPEVQIKSNISFTLKLLWKNGEKIIEF